jgi:hypothetical protein
VKRIQTCIIHCIKLLVWEPEDKKRLEDVDIHGSLILEMFLKKYGRMMRIGFSWPSRTRL